MPIFDRLYNLMREVDRRGFNPRKENYLQRITQLMDEEFKSPVNPKSPNVNNRQKIIDQAKDISRRENVDLGFGQRGQYKTREGKYVLNKEVWEKNAEHITKGKMPGISKSIAGKVEKIGDMYVIDEPSGSSELSESYYSGETVFYDAINNTMMEGQNLDINSSFVRDVMKQGAANTLNVLNRIPAEQYRQAGYADVEDFIEKELPHLKSFGQKDEGNGNR